MSSEMFQGPSFQENIKFPHNDVERGSFQSICRRTKKMQSKFQFLLFWQTTTDHAFFTGFASNRS